MLRTDSTALTYKSALPDSIVAGDEFLSRISSLVPGVHVVPLAQGNSGRSDKGGIKCIDGLAGGGGGSNCSVCGISTSRLRSSRFKSNCINCSEINLGNAMESPTNSRRLNKIEPRNCCKLRPLVSVCKPRPAEKCNTPQQKHWSVP